MTTGTVGFIAGRPSPSRRKQDVLIRARNQIAHHLQANPPTPIKLTVR